MNTINNLTDKEKNLLGIRKTFTDGNQGKIDCIIQELVLKQLIKYNKDNLTIKHQNKLDDYEVWFLQAYRLLDKEYKITLAERLYEINLEKTENKQFTKLMVVK